MTAAAAERRRFQITGTVQGVGFRPYVHALARRHMLGGFVLNDGSGVVVEAEGARDALHAFAAALRAEAPPLARVDQVVSLPVAPRGEREFSILASDAAAVRSAALPPDTATCDDCLRELFDPADRRHRYPFINCTQCGPRLTIAESVPYDRVNTTMAAFEMCADCRREYEDPDDRRFHAEPIACRACGPRVRVEGACPWLDGDEVARAAGGLRAGLIVALKGLGGYHLACDARNEEVVARLRRRKHRDEKPFAVMAADPAALAEVDDSARELLASPAAPIVLLERREDAGLAPSVAPGTGLIGVMLPYTPLHHLLVRDFGGPLVMTSGNRSDEPIAHEDDDARERLAPIADAFLVHDRPIRRRCEDSVVRDGVPLRRSRGYAPQPLPLPRSAGHVIVAAGAELKATFCVARGHDAFMSGHLGDLGSPLARAAFEQDLRLWLEMLGATPELVAHDLHPGYHSTRWALEQDVPAIGVQHHHAHAASCLAEHGRDEPALALVFDGTGYGADGTLWGGELLRCDLAEFERIGHLAAVPLAGAEAAIREPWRTAAAYLEQAGRPVPWERWRLVRQALSVNAPLSSGAGRLFDAVAAVLGVREEISYEGQAAAELEQVAGATAAAGYPCGIDGGVIRGCDLVAAAHDDHAAGRPAAEIAAAFHEGLAAAAVALCAEARGPRVVALSGGTFQNRRLREAVTAGLEAEGFEVLCHRRVPAGDGGISYGQAAVAARRMM